MSETSPVPYRVTSDAFIERIDPEQIPDQVGEELSQLAMERRATQDRLTVIHEAGYYRRVKRAFACTLSLLMAAGIAIAITGTISIGWAVGWAFGSMFTSLVFSAVVSDFRKPIETEEARGLALRQTALIERGARLQSLERLTGKHEQAMGLRNEVELFNLDVARLDLQECSPSDLAMIETRRREIIRRIGDFRQKVLDAPTLPPALPAPTDDRT